MRALAVCIACVIASSLAGCGASETLPKPDAAIATDGSGGRDAVDAVDDARDAGTDGLTDGPADQARDVIATDAQDAADVAPDAPAGDVAAEDAAPDGALDASLEAGSDAPVDAGPLLVTLQFTGTVQTVAGTPLGLDSSVRLASVSGLFAYDLRVGDNNPLDPTRGKYLHNGTSQFAFTVSNHTVTGSGLAITEVENLNPDTFRFLDGQQNDGVTRIMKLDGAGDPALALSIAITDTTGAALTSDAQPDPFPFTNITAYPHTFSIQDGTTGTLLMQLDSIVMQ